MRKKKYEIQLNYKTNNTQKKLDLESSNSDILIFNHCALKFNKLIFKIISIS